MRYTAHDRPSTPSRCTIFISLQSHLQCILVWQQTTSEYVYFPAFIAANTVITITHLHEFATYAHTDEYALLLNVITLMG